MPRDTDTAATWPRDIWFDCATAKPGIVCHDLTNIKMKIEVMYQQFNAKFVIGGRLSDSREKMMLIGCEK